MIYADYAEIRGENFLEHPVNDYQTGSIRDGFDFGPAMLISTVAARRALRKCGTIPPCRWAGGYDLRLKLSTDRALFHLPERLSVVAEAAAAGTDGTGKSVEGPFAYVDPRNREFQQEMEAAATAHLADLASCPGVSRCFAFARSFRGGEHRHPCPNRARTVADAVKSPARGLIFRST
jgi:hypothetical protein